MTDTMGPTGRGSRHHHRPRRSRRPADPRVEIVVVQPVPPPDALPTADVDGPSQSPPVDNRLESGETTQALLAIPSSEPLYRVPPETPAHETLAVATPQDRRAPGVLSETLEAVDTQIEPPSEHFVRGVRIDATLGTWNLWPTDVKAGGSWARVTTTEHYDIPSIELYGAAVTLDTEYFALKLAVESDQGFSLGVADSTLLDMVVAVVDVPILDRFKLNVRRLDFVNGSVELRERDSGAVVESAEFAVEMTRAELRYHPEHRLERRLGLYVYLGYVEHGLPRNVYLAEDGPTGDPIYYQVSEQLLRVDTSAAILGVGVDPLALSSVDDSGSGPPEGWVATARLGIGAGRYDIRTLAHGTRLDGGSLLAATGAMGLSYTIRLGRIFRVGVRDELSLTYLEPDGLPDKLDDELRAEGLDTRDFKLIFGMVEVANHAMVLASIDL